MNGSESSNSQALTSHNGAIPPTGCESIRDQQQRDARRWWIKLALQPVLFLIAGVALITLLGVAQRIGFISSGSNVSGPPLSAGAASTRFICPMMCTPPSAEAGRCPVCAMELVAATSAGGNTDPHGITVDPVARRVANIRTVAVQSAPVSRSIHGIGQLQYDESRLKTISAYVDARLERLYADYTGVVLAKGDKLALLYSPHLYTSQVELLTTKRSLDQGPSTPKVAESNRRLYASARQRLIEWGMTERQVAQLELDNQAKSRLQLLAPTSGTVIEKLAVEGQYVKTGQPIFRLADLSSVWLILELFPEDAAAIRVGAEVRAEVESLPGKTFRGQVAFIQPAVDPKTRTVAVRVVIPNPDGRLRIGELAKATIDAPLDRDAPAMVVPRSAVLMTGNRSVVYVETDPGRFELRRVVVGPTTGDQVVLYDGVMEGDQVAYRGNFLIDSQMQLAGNPSLIDPGKAQPIVEFELDETDLPPIATPQRIADQGQEMAK